MVKPALKTVEGGAPREPSPENDPVIPLAIRGLTVAYGAKPGVSAAHLAPPPAPPPATVPPTPPPTRGLAVACGGKPVVYDVDFVPPTGRMAAIIGPNGAGKPSLLQAAPGLAPRAPARGCPSA